MANPDIDTAETAIKTGDLDQCLAALSRAIRSEPANVKLRTFMFQLLCIRAEWDRALVQLNVASEMSSSAIPMKQVYEQPILCERLRSAVFAGEKVPMVFGQPPDWLAKMIEALLVEAAGKRHEAVDLRLAALETAPASAGEIDGMPFAWLCDADSRLGPTLEAVINNKYYWIPFENLSKIDFEKPEDLRDRVWTPAHLEFVNGGEVLALIPTRYAGTETSGRHDLLLSRATDWVEKSPGCYCGLGQRMFSSDFGDHSLMDIRTVSFAQRAVEDLPVENV